MSHPTTGIAGVTRQKISRRILPFFFLLYVISYLDRANVSFAKLTMAVDLGFSEAVYGFGAGVFFLGYIVLEIPGALIVEKWSARLWMSRILITWGLCTVWVGFVRTPNQFYLARFCLGLAEAGFFPGVLVYLSRWFPQNDRARALSKFFLSIPISFAIGAPLSALCLSIHWLGLPGWRWLFILQGLPAIVCGIVAPFYLTDHPAKAKWLEPAQKEWLFAELELETQSNRSRGPLTAVLRDWRVWLLAASLLFTVFASYGFILWLPSTIKSASGLSTISSTLLSSLPFCAASVCVVLMGRSSDRTSERIFHTAIPLFAAGCFFACVALPGQPFALTMFWLVCTGAMLWAWSPSFWVLPTLMLGRSGAAAAFGLINSVGSLGGFLGPSLVGYLLSKQHSYSLAIGLLSIAFALAAGLILLLGLLLGSVSQSYRAESAPVTLEIRTRE